MLVLAMQLVQWFCLLMMTAAFAFGVQAVAVSRWDSAGLCALAFVLWGLGALIASIILHWCACLLPD